MTAENIQVNGESDAPHNLPFILLISCVATIGGFLFGYDSGVINGTIDGLAHAFNSNDVGTGFNVSSMLLGCAAGAFFAGRLADVYGRKALLVVAAVLFIVSAWGSGIAGDSISFVLFRIIGGLAVGAASVMTPAYISEIAPANIRGRLSSIQQVAIICGLFAAFCCNYWLANTAGGSMEIFWMGYETWRWMFWVELIPAVLFLVALFVIPESPRFLVAADKTEKAAATLGKLFGGNSGEEKTSFVASKIEDIRNSLSSDHKPKLADLFSGSTVKPIVWVGIGLAVFQQLVGINVVFYYGAVLWQSVGFSENDALQINIISGGVSIVACLIALTLIDRIGRKPLLCIGSIGMALTLTVLTICFFTADKGVDGQLSMSDSVGLIALVSANAYLAFFNFSWGPVMWVMLGEMFPNQMRGSGLAVAGLFQWLANFLITMSFKPLLGSIGLASAYGIYTFFAFVSIGFVWRYVHETRNKELEEMDEGALVGNAATNNS